MDNLFKNRFRIPSARLQTWDYSSEGAYYITICVGGGVHALGRVDDGVMIPSEVGRIAQNFWMEIPQHFPFIILDEFVVMPNHVHGILIINNKDNPCCNSRDEAIPCRDKAMPCLYDRPSADSSSGKKRFQNQGKNTISSIVGSYKSAVTKQARAINPSFGWQPRFYDRIIRDAEEFDRIRDYIFKNPSRWHEDKYYK